MISLKTVKQIEKAPIEDRLEFIKLLLRSLRRDMASNTRRTKAKPFKVQKFSFGQEVQVDRDELYSKKDLSIFEPISKTEIK
jgi:hypothetical protein